MNQSGLELAVLKGPANPAVEYDTESTVFGRPEQIELDVIIRTGCY